MNRPSYLLILISISPALLLAGCGGGACHADLSGNFSASSDSGCPTLSHPAAPGATDDWNLDFQVVLGATTGTLQVSVDLGPSPATGQFSSETATAWSAVIGSASDCLYSAAADAVPTGSFTLDLTSVDGLDGAAPSAHGNLKIVQYVHAPAGVDCGEGDVENVSVSF
jgi:hypothetical protein